MKKLFCMAFFMSTMVLAHGAVPQAADAASAAEKMAGQSTQSALSAENENASKLVDARIKNEDAQANYYKKQANEPPFWSFSKWFPTALGGFLAILGGIFTSIVTERRAEKKSRHEEQRTYTRQKTQLGLATVELLAVLERITQDPRLDLSFLSETLLYEKRPRPEQHNRNDRYYLKYDLVNTIYRLCAFLGWLELYRTDPTFLRNSPEDARGLDKEFRKIRAAFGDERGNDTMVDGKSRKDGFILEGDQRAIGEKMISKRRGDFVIGYAAFCETLFRDPLPDNVTDGNHPTSQDWWIWNATRFFVEIGKRSEVPDVIDVSIDRLKDVVKSLKEVKEIVQYETDPEKISQRSE